uniref:Crustacean hyperglycemic hormone isoform 1 n=1 Tax=Rimicaris kairei TaxID=651863 RepID=C7AE75_9EUCA|nr:crustacean hyperglycemic hormone isoform 1 [Rimicaris kairei]
MISNGVMWLAMIVVVLVLGSNSQVFGRSVDSVDRMEKLLASSSSSLVHPSGLAALTASHSLNKRAVFDQSCKGIYDRELFRKLDRVCEDCYNLYRKPYVGVECRRKCFGTSTFRQCVEAQLLDVEDHIGMRDSLAYM